MAKAIKLKDLKKVLTLATSSTKKLVEAGVQGQDTFPTLLAEYKWSGTRDFNLALIIIALYAYCLKQDGDLKTMAQWAINKSKSANEDSDSNAFNALKHGKGAKLVEYLKKDFIKDIQKLIFGVSNKDTFDDDETIQVNGKDLTQEEFENMLNKTFEDGLFKQAKKIKPWKTNEKDVDYCISKLKDDIWKTRIYDQGETYVKETQDKDAEIRNLKQDNEKIKQKLEFSSNIIKDYYNQIDQHFIQYIKLTQQLEELKKELKNSKLTIEEQKKQIQEYKNIIDTMRNTIDKEINQMVAMSKKDILKAESKKYEENLKKFESIKKETDTLSETVEALLLDVDKKTLSKNKLSDKNRRKSMGDKPFSTITSDELKKARKNLKSVDSDLNEKIQNQRKKFKKGTEEWLEETDAHEPSINPAQYKKDSEEIASKRKEILKPTEESND